MASKDEAAQVLAKRLGAELNDGFQDQFRVVAPYEDGWLFVTRHVGEEQGMPFSYMVVGIGVCAYEPSSKSNDQAYAEAAERNMAENTEDSLAEGE